MTSNNKQELETQEVIIVDKFDRNDLIKSYTNILDNTSSPYVISINAPYGRGKTVFLDMWADHLRKREIDPTPDGEPVIFKFDAWETDFTQHPLVAFTVTFYEFLKQNDIFNDICNELVADIDAILGHAGKRFLTAITLGLISQGQLQEELNDQAKVQGSFGAAASHLRDYENTKLGILNLKKALKTVALKAQETSNHDIVIMVDELDRCRPSYAVEFLEMIKHIFNQSGYIFIVAINNKQLQHAVRAVYGNSFEGENYLRRFFDLELVLPEVDFSSFIKDNILKRNIKSVDDDLAGSIAIQLAKFSKKLSLEARDVNKVINTLEALIKTDSSFKIIPSIICFLIALREKNRDSYELLGSQPGFHGTSPFKYSFEQMRENGLLDSLGDGELTLYMNLLCSTDINNYMQSGTGEQKRDKQHLWHTLRAHGYTNVNVGVAPHSSMIYELKQRIDMSSSLLL